MIKNLIFNNRKAGYHTLPIQLNRGLFIIKVKTLDFNQVIKFVFR